MINLQIAPQLIEKVLKQYSKRFIKKTETLWNAECPICGEGRSSGRKRRLFYFVDKNYFYCHNCCRSWNPLQWIQEVTHWSLNEIYNYNKQYQFQALCHNNIKTNKTSLEEVKLQLPKFTYEIKHLSSDCQLGERQWWVLSRAQIYCQQRKLWEAISSPLYFFVSFDSNSSHFERLIIPFFDQNFKLIFYQSRALLQEQHPKYLSATGFEKPLYGLHALKSAEQKPWLFLCEGPIDAMFLENGLALGGLWPNELQKKQLAQIAQNYSNKVVILDFDRAGYRVIEKWIQTFPDWKIFVWPRNQLVKKCLWQEGQKIDLNSLCLKQNKNYVDPQWILENSFSDLWEIKMRWQINYC